ncbi:MAG: hypothetical protein H0W64_11145 [Gammaproteobacteria bacterium]|nr:hypothetical protein [Gammaproteobacteria bacterium]
MFYEEHEEALIYLSKKGLSSEQAIEIVSNLSIDEAQGIAEGLARNDVLQLNANQIKSLSALQDYGLTVEHLRNCQLPKGLQFGPAHQQALCFLIKEKQMNPEVAIAEINQLGSDGAYAIATGLCRSQVLGLNRYQHKTLLKLQQYGLTAEHLRSWQLPSDEKEFYNGHKDALIYLLQVRNLSPENAIKEINAVTSGQAAGIAKGLMRTEVIGLQEEQVNSLIDLREKGFSEFPAEHLKQWQGAYFSTSHKNALINLVEKRHYKSAAAVAEINNLNEFEARSIAENNLTRDEVLGFNGWQIRLLARLKNKGFTYSHMRSWQAPNESEHFLAGLNDAVIYLIKKGMKAEDVISEINGLTNNQAARLVKGETREQILNCASSLRP